ncbi:FIG004556: membrane metalloprotease [uncultured Gammaproteobacteria bacterium]|jgi:Zn-dependent protease|uniref:Membrane protein containing Peptidase M50domain n=4 Tax=Gammaproteobacteria incertae sedis TaxID=118884 RepID=A0A1H6KLI2_9GAMM|nr:FIG004556: membrane metalloprotease [Bathymodiolus azoricus thioautotrophic gill symbiont]CAB5508402.1 FIG004556: membrane metalloprotease [Bathymodiolus thermophilus thioautotrophic gill symbiont]CAC9497293.1 FIG004556: membrane metalloprotease [uncultured Gammaproteobacteria bacterium]CAC9517181.1 FIG004556: membrane metalloprotease [uncultured Gammaproteobacteria bacterium]CAC9517956.1 FIG004556: membrane metalloprotease [uncultured Gammaproteobacteria bacterium]
MILPMPDFQTLLIYAIPLIFAITVHEFAHGWVANQRGDSTARMLGRLTLNPIKHIDPVGTILMPAILFFTGSPFLFGWAKPVPINFNALKSPKQDMILVALAGPVSNFIMALLWLLVIVFTLNLQSQLLIDMAHFGIAINLVLGVFNLLPLPPLDGSRVVSALLPNHLAYRYNKLEAYGLYILLGLLFLGIFERVILPIVNFILNYLLGLLN